MVASYKLTYQMKYVFLSVCQHVYMYDRLLLEFNVNFLTLARLKSLKALVNTSSSATIVCCF